MFDNRIRKGFAHPKYTGGTAGVPFRPAKSYPKESKDGPMRWDHLRMKKPRTDASAGSKIAKQTHRTRANPAKDFHRTQESACSQSRRYEPNETVNRLLRLRLQSRAFSQLI